jgi:glyoxylase-like metal-dependent hydrolase (beta-lactamase superfamily II)
MTIIVDTGAGNDRNRPQVPQFHMLRTHSCFCEDPEQARATRRGVLAEAADTRTLVVPAHFPGHGATEVSRDGDGFTVRGWAPLDLLHPATPRVST